MRLADPIPLVMDVIWLPIGAGCVLDQGNAVAICQSDKRGQIARHPHLVDGQDRSRTCR